MSEKWRQCDIFNVINDKPQVSIAKNLRCDKLHYYAFIVQSAGEFFLKLLNI